MRHLEYSALQEADPYHVNKGMNWSCLRVGLG